jgi:hypothetical protein
MIIPQKVRLRIPREGKRRRPQFLGNLPHLLLIARVKDGKLKQTSIGPTNAEEV